MQRRIKDGWAAAILLAGLTLGACGQPTTAPSAQDIGTVSTATVDTTVATPAADSSAAQATAAPAAANDILTMSQDQLIEAARQEGEVIFYAWWGEEFWKEAARRFSEQYGIKANVIIGDPVEKVLAEKDKAEGTIDAILVGGTNVKLTMDADVFYGPILPGVPEADKLDQKLATYQEGIETKGYLVPIYRNQTGLLYDPERVPTPPQTWDELVAFIQQNPQQFAFCDPNKGGSGQAFVQTVIVNTAGGLDQYHGDTELVEDKVAGWKNAWDWLRQNNDKMVLTASNNESIDLLNQGAVSLIVAWDDDTQIALNKGTLFKRAKMYIPTMGLPGGGDTAGVLKNAPHKAASLLFIDFLTSSPMQQLMNETIGSYPARTDLTGVKELIPEEQRTKLGVYWYPAAYKEHANVEFTKNVLMQQ